MITQMLRNFIKPKQLYAEDYIKQREEADDTTVLSLTQEEIYDSLYKYTLDLFKAAMKSGSLKRPQILYIKELLNKQLGDKKKYYSNKYKNDCHEIYTKLQSPFLCNQDYQKLINTINTFTN